MMNDYNAIVNISNCNVKSFIVLTITIEEIRLNVFISWIKQTGVSP